MKTYYIQNVGNVGFKKKIKKLLNFLDNLNSKNKQ